MLAVSTASDSIPGDIDALRAALAAEQLARREAEARASGAEAMVAHLKLLIAKLKHDRFGASSERGRKLLDQMELELEELDSARTARQEFERRRRQSAGRVRPRPWPRMVSIRSRCRSNFVGERRFGAARRSSTVASASSSEATRATSFARCSAVSVCGRRCQSCRVAQWRTRRIKHSGMQ